MQKTATDKLNEQKKFALMMSWAIPLFFYILLPWIFSLSRQLWPFYISAVFLFLYVFLPQFIQYPYHIWMFISRILGWLNTRIILGLTFFGIILPMGIFLKIFKKLNYSSAIDKNRESYYIAINKKITKEDLEHPF